MNSLLIYMAKAALYLAGFYFIYSIFLSRDTKYLRNRAFIMLAVIASFILPLVSVNVREQSSIYYLGKTLSEVFVTAYGQKSGTVSTSGIDLNFFSILSKIYLAGIILFGLKLLGDTVNLLILILRNRKSGENIIYFKGFYTAGFSAMGYIFINHSLGQVEACEIIRHERNHLENNHFVDILFIETALVFQWFNPSIYLINRSLRAIHEFQADQGCLKAGMPVTSYQNLLLSNVFRSRRINIFNSFSNPSLIKKRIIMMTKKRTPDLANFKILLVLPVTILLLVFISSCKISSKSSVAKTEVASVPPSEVFVVVEEMPLFPGGEKAMFDFIYANLRYPENEKKNNIQGRVILRFCVNYLGGIDRVSVLKSVNPALDAEAIRVIKILPTWQPGKQGGKPVSVWYSVPVIFEL
jgi:TonB family protein